MKTKSILCTLICCLIIIFAISGQSNSNSEQGWKIFREVPKFSNGSTTYQAGFGLNSIIAIKKMALQNDGFEAKPLLPAVGFGIEKCIGHNLGLGLSIGTQMWRVPKIEVFDEKFRFKYRLFAIGVAGKYHLNIGKKWDSYVGLGISYRYMDITRSIRSLDSNWNIGLTTLWGISYYPQSNWGLFLEIGSATTSVYRLGATKNIIAKKRN